MRRITALSLAIALVGLLAGLVAGMPAAATSVEDERTEAIIAVVGQDPNASLVGTAPAPGPIAAKADGEVAIDDLTALAPDAAVDPTSILLRGDVLYDLDARPGVSPDASATPLDGISGFAQRRVIGLHAVDLGEVRVSN